jgi:serine/threonine-protein kinase RsbW
MLRRSARKHSESAPPTQPPLTFARATMRPHRRPRAPPPTTPNPNRSLPDASRGLTSGNSGHVRGVPSASWTIHAIAENVPRVRRDAVCFAQEHGVPASVLSDVRLAVSEAVTNSVMHAFRDHAEPGRVTVSMTVTLAENAVEALVVDDGIGMTPRDDSPGLGLGLGLIRHLTHEADHRRPAGGVGTEVWMRFRFGPEVE